MRYHEIMEKSEPNNPQLWGRAKAEATKRYKKHSAYKMGWAAKWYKEKGGTWKTVSETIEDMITEISRPEFRNEAVELLTSKGYEELGSEKWVDISRKEGGKHPECGASAGKGRRKKSNNAAYPKCVKQSKAKTMTKKEKESASRRKRNVERKSSGKSPNMVKTET